MHTNIRCRAPLDALHEQFVTSNSWRTLRASTRCTGSRLTMTSSPESIKRESSYRALPGELEANFVVVTGATLRMRPIRDEDAQKLIEFHARLSFDSIYRRTSPYTRALPR